MPTNDDYGARGRKLPTELPRGVRSKTLFGVRSSRGFASMSPERRAEVSSKGGKKAHQLGTAHEWTKPEAKAAGSVGGKTKTGDGTTGRAALERRRAAATGTTTSTGKDTSNGR